MFPTETVVPRPAAKLDYINALRGLAILGVLLVHVLAFGGDAVYLTKIAITFFYQGARGVQLFFVASAFTLWLSMSRRKQEKHPTRNFFLRRFFRIAPMYYLGIAFYGYWWTAVEPRGTVTVASILANFTFLHGTNPYWINSVVPGGWSITVEMWFYCLAPLLFIKLKTVNQCARFIAIGILANCFLSLALTHSHMVADINIWSDFLFYYFPSQLPVFGFGILLYLLIVDKIQPKTMKGSTWLLAAGAALLMLLTGLPYQEELVPAPELHYWFSAAFVLLAIGLSMYSPRLLVNPIVNYIGEVSFSIYLVHFAVLYALKVLGFERFVIPTSPFTALTDFGIRYVVVLSISVTLATFFYRLIELPFQKLGKYLISHLER